MKERRKTVRQRSYLGGRVAFDNRCSTLECTVRNLSSAGAKIAFSSITLLPQHFDLSIEQKGLHARARVVWRSPTEMGLALSEVSTEGTTEGIPLDIAQRLRKLEAEKAALKQRIAALSTGDYVP